MTLKLVWPVDIVSCSIKCESHQYSIKILFSKNGVLNLYHAIDYLKIDLCQYTRYYDRKNKFLMQDTLAVQNI